MNELKFLDEYSGQSTEELILLEKEYRTDSIVLAFEQALDLKLAQSSKKALSKEEFMILAVEALEREINNGGYEQFFSSPFANAYAPHIIEALNNIGCKDVADLTRRAINCLNISGEITIEAINDVLDNDDDKTLDCLNECDRQYYEMPNDLATPLFEFIKANKDKIILK